MGTRESLKKGIWLTEKNVTGLQSGKNSIFIFQHILAIILHALELLNLARCPKKH